MDFIYLIIEKQTNRVVRAFVSQLSAETDLAAYGDCSKDYCVQIVKVRS